MSRFDLFFFMCHTFSYHASIICKYIYFFMKYISQRVCQSEKYKELTFYWKRTQKNIIIAVIKFNDKIFKSIWVYLCELSYCFYSNVMISNRTFKCQCYRNTHLCVLSEIKDSWHARKSIYTYKWIGKTIIVYEARLFIYK